MTKPLHRASVSAILVASLGGTGAVLAHTVPPSIAECAAIDADADRLACYDRASGRAAARTPTPAQPAARDVQAPAQATAGSETGAAPAATAAAKGSMIDAAWGFDPGSTRYSIAFYNPNYVLFARYSNNVNNQPFTPLFQALQQQPQDLDSTEAKFQLSFKVRLWTTHDRRWGVWAAYTQQSQWQVYNSDISRPFRETDYMPELILSYRPGVELGGFQWRLLNVGYNHQSNGRSDSLSRSWDRIVAEFGVERGNLALLAKVWYRIPESAAEDDNPDITDYYGYGGLSAVYKWHDHSFALMGRGNLGTGKGAVQFTWTSPRILGPLRAYVQAFSGYGESLIDYNWDQSTIGIGFALNDLL
jgi:phospholipase A1